MLSLCVNVSCVCVLFVYIISISIICVSQEEFSLIAYVWLLQVSNFWKEKTSWKVNFWCQWIIQCNTDSCCEQVKDGVYIFIWVYQSICPWVCFVCVISNKSTSKKLHYMSDLSKLDALLHKTHSKILLVPRLNIDP